MVTVRAIQPFKRRGQIIHPGDSFEIPADILPELAGLVEVITLQALVGQTLAEVDRLGRPWPSPFFAYLPEEDRQRLRELERQIDAAVIGNDAESLPGLLNEWRRLLLSKLN